MFDYLCIYLFISIYLSIYLYISHSLYRLAGVKSKISVTVVDGKDYVGADIDESYTLTVNAKVI